MYLLVMCDNFSIHLDKLVCDLKDSQSECVGNTRAKMCGIPGRWIFFNIIMSLSGSHPTFFSFGESSHCSSVLLYFIVVFSWMLSTVMTTQRFCHLRCKYIKKHIQYLSLEIKGTHNIYCSWVLKMFKTALLVLQSTTLQHK